MPRLDPETERLVSEFFAEQVCCKCKEAAGRCWKGKFFCYECFDALFAKEDCRMYRLSLERQG